MTEYKTENKLGVGEILICNQDTNGKLEPLKYFIGKVIINIGGGGEKIYIIEEKDKISSEVKSIQSRSNFNKKMMMTNTEMKFRSQVSVAHTVKEGAMEMEDQPEDIEEARKSAMSNSFKKTKSGLSFSAMGKENMEEGRATLNLDMHDIHEVDEINETHEDPADMDIGRKMSMLSVKKDAINPIQKKDSVISVSKEENQLERKLSSLTGMPINPKDSNLSRKMTNNLEMKADISNFDDNAIMEGVDNQNQNEISQMRENVRGNKRLDTQIVNEGPKEIDHEPQNNPNMAENATKGSDMISQQTSNDFNHNTIGFSEKEQQIIQIVKGKHHLLKLTMDGKVYGSGHSYFGVVGLGGAMSADKPTLLPNLAKIKIVQIACGMYHSMALSQSGDLYVWGMGFEGQLGINSKYKVASSPRYLNFFYKKPVKFIACGHNYSLCITNDSLLWGWGENKLGQLGLGKIQILDKPTHIQLLDLPGNQEGCNQADSFINTNLDRPYTSQLLNACYISAGFAHTAVVTEEGYLLTFGLNIYGQLGLGNTISTFEPRLIEKDDNGEYMGKIVKVCCSVKGTFIITEEGRLYTCGSGEIGHGDMGVIKLPRLVSDSRVYQHIFCNDNSVVAFCPLRIISISPSCGPAAGNTILSIIGSALKEFPKLSVRFVFGGVARDVKATFDKISRTIFVRTPNFLELCPGLELPCHCKVQLTFDGAYFTEYQDSFLIYSSTIKLTGIEPRCGPIIGGSQLNVKINLEGINPKYLFSLTCGFQAKPAIQETSSVKKVKSKKMGGNISSQNLTRSNDTLEESKISVEEGKSNIGTISHGREKDAYSVSNINPMDFAHIESQLDKANWVCCFGTYENGILTCSIPKIENFNQNQVEYNVDVAINGQQFTGFPMIYRFYDIKIDKMEPNISSLEGGLLMKIYGTGLFDSVTKKARISSQLGERYSDLQWDRNEKALILVSNPILWITNDEDVIRNIPPSDLYENYPFDVHITMNNNLDWIYAGSYRYYDPKIIRVVYHLFPENKSKDERLLEIATPESLSPEEKIFIGIGTYPEDKKKKDEIEKKRNEEDNLINTTYKRPYNGLSLYSNFFPNTQLLKVKLVSQTCEQDIIAFYKNRYKISCLIPEINKLPAGQHELKIMVSINSQNYFPAGKTILFIAPEFGLKFEDIVKLDEQDAKGGKKGGTKNVKK